VKKLHGRVAIKLADGRRVDSERVGGNRAV
jgi:hypothetical protein